MCFIPPASVWQHMHTHWPTCFHGKLLANARIQLVCVGFLRNVQTPVGQSSALPDISLKQNLINRTKYFVLKKKKGFPANRKNDSVANSIFSSEKKTACGNKGGLIKTSSSNKSSLFLKKTIHKEWKKNGAYGNDGA